MSLALPKTEFDADKVKKSCSQRHIKDIMKECTLSEATSMQDGTSVYSRHEQTTANPLNIPDNTMHRPQREQSFFKALNQQHDQGD